MSVVRRKAGPSGRFSFRRILGAKSHGAPASAKHRPTYRAETLEGRCLLSAVTWTGTHNNGLWTDPLNWTGGTGVPTASDNVTIGSGFTTISIPSGIQSINSLTCASPLQINGGSLVLATTSTVSTLTISSGTLDGAGNVTVSGALTWSGGTMQGTGKTVSAVGGTLSIDTSTHNLARVLESDGTATWTAGDLQMMGGTFNNNGSFTFNSAAAYQSEGVSYFNAFNNAGSFTKLGAGELDFHGNVNNSFGPTSLPFNNTGTISVQAGILSIEGVLGTSSGHMSTTAPGTLLIGYGYTFNASATITGDGTIGLAGNYSFAPGQFSPTGTVNFISGTITVNNAFTPTALGTIGATVTFNNAVNYNGAVNIHGWATFAAAESFSALTLTGTLDGAGDVTVTGALVWSGGRMQGTGKTVSAATGTLSINTSTSLNLSRVLESDGTATWTGGNLDMNGGTLNNNGSFTYDSAARWDIYGVGGTSTFNNVGSLTKQGAGELDLYTGFVPVAFNNANTGTVSVQAGVMSLQTVPNLAGGTLTGGAWDVFSNSTLKLPGSITTLAANVQLNGVGSIITASGGGANALSGLAAIASGGSLSLQGGQSLSAMPAGGTFTNHGTVNLGAGSHLSVAGAFTQGADGSFITQLSGPTSASFGQLTATGAVTIGGALEANLGAGYDPAAGQTFSVVTGSSRAGSFSSFSGGTTPGGLPLLLNYSATSATISINPIPLSYVGTQIDDGNRQRSLVRSLTFSFSSPVTLAAGAVTLARLNSGGSGSNDGSTPSDASAALGAPSSSDGGLTWTIPIVTSSAFSAFGSLTDGVYTATIHATLVTDAFGQTLSGGDQTKTFHRLYGDINGDKKISNADFTFFSNAYNASFGPANYNPYFDFTNKNAKIGNSDFTQFANRYNKQFTYTG
ncbi:MAG: hypothetical protein JWN24_3537 [Phycisphaerales bacterium]|nr:hypothetical protein [Phycisphaerales bacterium]